MTYPAAAISLPHGRLAARAARRGSDVDYPTFDETCLSAICFNRAQQHLDNVHVISKYRDGRHGTEWHTTTWRDEIDGLHQLSLAWGALGVEPQQTVALMAKNRPRWIHTAMSLIANNIVLVPIYPTLMPEDAAFVLRDSGARHIVVDTVEQARKILSVADDLPQLDRIIVMDPLEGEIPDGLTSWDGMLALAGSSLDLQPLFGRVRETTTDDLVSIIYTSGTTGRPKGVMLTNGNYLSQRFLLDEYDLNSGDVFLNHLPFCHSFGLTADVLASSDVGATLAIADGFAPEQIRHALTTIRPTVLMSVPRLFEKIYIQVNQVVSARPRQIQNTFHMAIHVGKQVFDCRNQGQPVPLTLRLKYKLAHRILMKVRKKSGLDRLRIAYAGGGPTSKELAAFFQSLGIDLYQGYGLTETSPVANVNAPHKNKLGTVGPPITGCEQKLADDGEILIRGTNVMKGYFNDPDATARAMDGDGWFRSGDIGTFDHDGYLTITDRKKELIVTAGGKNIAPLKIESAYNTETYIERIVVVGNNRKFLSALLCPNVELLRDWADGQGLRYADEQALLEHPQVLALFQQRVDHVNGAFARFEQIKKFVLMDHEFSELTGELTPTQKVRRKVVDEMYGDAIDELYA